MADTHSHIDPIDGLVAGLAKMSATDMGMGAHAWGEALAHQHPHIAGCSCCDSRADLNVATGVGLNEVFTFNKSIGAHVEPHRADSQTAAAVEYARLGLGISEFVIMSHGRCGAVGATISAMNGKAPEGIPDVIGFAHKALLPTAQAVAKHVGDVDAKTLARTTEQAVALESVNNLLGYPGVKEAVAEGKMTVHAMYFDLDRKTIMGYNAKDGRFMDLTEETLPAYKAGLFRPTAGATLPVVPAPDTTVTGATWAPLARATAHAARPATPRMGM